MKSLATLTPRGAGSAGPAVIFDRSVELDGLRNRVAGGRSFLFHGPTGVGKTLLLSAVCSEFSRVLWSAQTQTPQALYKNLADALLLARDPRLVKACPAGASFLQKKSAIALKGIVREALRDSQYVVVLDHLVRPSQLLAAGVRELIIDCSVPVIAVSRSDHMEDAGFLLPMFPDRSERCALRNFNADTAKLFAAWSAREEGLTSGNLAQFLDSVVAYGEGNPGAIRKMIRMAREPQYSCGGQIKSAPLYIDYKIAMVKQ